MLTGAGRKESSYPNHNPEEIITTKTILENLCKLLEPSLEGGIARGTLNDLRERYGRRSDLYDASGETRIRRLEG